MKVVDEKIEFIVNKLYRHSSGCLIYPNNRSKQEGYNYITYNEKTWAIHRLVFALYYRIINLPSWAHICHSCDNPPCCEIIHLFLGNAKINSIDARDKGRLYIGKGVIYGKPLRMKS